jgi:hypothetical protein
LMRECDQTKKSKAGLSAMLNTNRF